jgi:hypothetical protein
MQRILSSSTFGEVYFRGGEQGVRDGVTRINSMLSRDGEGIAFSWHLAVNLLVCLTVSGPVNQSESAWAAAHRQLRDNKRAIGNSSVHRCSDGSRSGR